MTPRSSKETNARDADRPAGEDQLSDEELRAQTGEALPDRAALSAIDADIAIPVNPALAADVLSGTADEAADEEPPQVADDEPAGPE